MRPKIRHPQPFPIYLKAARPLILADVTNQRPILKQIFTELGSTLELLHAVRTRPDFGK